MVNLPRRPIEDWAKPRTVVVMTLVLLCALWTVVIGVAIANRQQSLAAIDKELQRTSTTVAEETRRQLDRAALTLIAGTHWLAARPQADPRSDPAFRQLLTAIRARTGASIDVALVRSDGALFDAFGKGPAPLANVAESDYFRNAPLNGEPYIGTPGRNIISERQVLPIAQRLDRPRHGIAMLVAGIDLSQLTTAYAGQGLSTGSTISLLRNDGTLLARTPEDESLLGKSIRDLQGFAATPGDSAQALIEAGHKQGEFTSYAALAGYPLTIVATESSDEALSPWLAQTLWTLLLAVGMSAPLVAIALRSLRLLRALAHQQLELQRLAHTDRLTGALSRQHFVDTMAEEIVRAQNEGARLSVLLFDIDFFQRINDGYGHAIGDQVLVAFATVVNRGLRARDVLARLGGGDFVLLLPDTGSDEAVAVAERIRSEIAAISIETENGTVQFTVSVGVSEATAADSSVEHLLKRARKALHDTTTARHDRVLVV